MPPEKIDSLADDVRSMVLELLRQNSGLTARVGELVTQNKALLARIAELEAEHGKPPKTPDNSSLPPSRGHKGNVAEPSVKKARKGIIRCTADPAKADKRTRSKWSRVMRYAAIYKPDSEPLDQFIRRKGGINTCAARFSHRVARLKASA
jgi:hypothetical protein